ncbi:MAG: hydroxyacid dehydrogenase [Desulfobulbus propionicus]|nr:MAG: hydroxyacid dehydrogenase [Desulfobulbus propionicus]
MTHHSVLILSPDAEEYLEFVNDARLPGLIVNSCQTVDPGNEVFKSCDIIFGAPDMTAQALSHTENLKWVQSTWAGVSPLLEPGMPQDYLLTGVKGIFGRAMGEYVLCHLLLHERKCITRFQNQLRKKWDIAPPGTIQGKTIGIMGLGSIGRDVAAMVKTFGMKTRGYSRSQVSCAHVDTCYLPHQLTAFLKDLDYLVCLLPDTSDTRGLLDEHAFAAMQESVLIINAGRGSLIDEHALISALENKRIGGAVLDVFTDEPLPQNHPLWDAPDTLITSHTAAPSFPQDIVPIFIENYYNFISGQPMKYVIDFQNGY